MASLDLGVCPTCGEAVHRPELADTTELNLASMTQVEVWRLDSCGHEYRQMVPLIDLR